jgi:hypothetical protein
MDNNQTNKFFDMYSDEVANTPNTSINSEKENVTNSIKENFKYSSIEIPKPTKISSKKKSLEKTIEEEPPVAGISLPTHYFPFGAVIGEQSGEFIADKYKKIGMQKGLIIGSCMVFGYFIQKYLEDKGFKIKIS